MSGHSKWATIKHKKGAQDKARGKLFAKLLRQVEVAAREGGGDPDANPTLRTMFQKARDASIPMDTIERAIKRGTGELEGVRYEQVDVGERPEIARRYGVRTVPTIVVAGASGDVLGTWTRVPPNGELASAAQRARAMA